MFLSPDFINGFARFVDKLPIDERDQFAETIFKAQDPKEILERIRTLAERLKGFGGLSPQISDQILQMVFNEQSSMQQALSKAEAQVEEAMEVDQELVQDESRKRGQDEISEEEPYLRTLQKQTRRLKLDDPIENGEVFLFKKEEKHFAALSAIFVDPEISTIYQSVFGNFCFASPETFELIKSAIKDHNFVKLLQANPVVMQVYQQLGQLQNAWRDIPEYERGKFGDIDSSEILDSPESCKLVLQIINAYNLRAIGMRIFRLFIDFQTPQELIARGEEISKELEKNRDQYTELNLCDAGITRLPLVVTTFRNLTYLDLSANPGIVIPEQMVNLSKLDTLLLAGCSLDEIPSWVFKLFSLTRLNVRGNHLKTLLPWITQLSQLTDLDISRNLITKCQYVIDELTSLQCLYISNDQLIAVPPKFLSKPGTKLEIVKK